MSSELYNPPPVEVGQSVHWYGDPASTPSAAIVTSVGHRAISLSVFLPGMATAFVPDGVFHIDDPQAQRSVENGTGVWDYMKPSYPSSRRQAVEAK